MARINTNVAALGAQRGLAKSQAQLSQTLTRLSSGLRINRGADDPAGLIASESLRSEVTGLTQAVDNSQRASNVIATAEGSLNEVSSLLQSIKSLVVQTANAGAISPDEVQANQLQINSAIQSITRIANTTTFAGLHLLDGSLDYLTSGVDKSTIQVLHINQASFGTNATVPVHVAVTSAARQAKLNFETSQITTSLTLEVRGNDGVETIHLDSGTHASAIAAAVNHISDVTGVTALPINSANPLSGITFRSAGYGSKSFVSITSQSGSFDTKVPGASGAHLNRTVGHDAVATINGVLAEANGLDLQVSTNALDLDLALDPNVTTASTDFVITGGGAMFQLGAQVRANQQASIAIPSMAASKLGDADVGYLNDLTGGSASLVGGHAEKASKIIERAITQVANLRGRLGAFEKNTLDTNMNSLQVAIENVTSSESTVRDADFAQETSNLTRSQILVQAGTSVLATANSTPQAVLSLLSK
jgi:flagellin